MYFHGYTRQYQPKTLSINYNVIKDIGLQFYLLSFVTKCTLCAIIMLSPKDLVSKLIFERITGLSLP